MGGVNHRTASSNRFPQTTCEQRAHWILRYHQSGLTQRAFASEHGIGLSTLGRWLRDSVPTAVEPPAKCGRAIWVTGRFKSAASSLTMKHVSQYGRLERDSQTRIDGRSESAADSSRDEDALAIVKKDLNLEPRLSMGLLR